MDITEIVQNDGPAVFADQQYGVIIVASLVPDRTYLNWWEQVDKGTYRLAAMRPCVVDVSTLPIFQARHLAEVWFNQRMGLVDPAHHDSESTE